MGNYIFESIAQFANVAKTTYTRMGANYTDIRWNDGQKHSDTYTMALLGDDSLVKDAEKMMEQLDSSVEVPTRLWNASMYGAYSVVPEFLAGSPTPMRSIQYEQTESVPLTIWVDLNCSAGFSAKQLLDHGTAILALLLKLQQVRPVELKLMCALPARQTRIVVGVNSKPLSLSEACFGLCRVAFCRNLMFGYATAKDGGFSDRIIDTEIELRKYMQIPESDLVIKGPHLHDKIMEDPIKWVNAQVKKFTEREEE